jgi:hypothetical protein
VKPFVEPTETIPGTSFKYDVFTAIDIKKKHEPLAVNWNRNQHSAACRRAK